MWRSFDDDALREAGERDVPVLLLLSASFCPHSRALEKRLEAEFGQLEDRFVCTREDQGDRPDLDTVHRGRGWPSVTLVSADGEILERVDGSTDAVARALLESDTTEASHASKERAKIESAIERITAMLLDSADASWGGWGARQKFPHPDALHFLLVRWSATGDARALETVLRTLRSMQAGEIHDGVEGGFFRYASQPDWSVPNYEKPLLSNAKRLLAYAEAYQVLGFEDLRRTALGVAEWMRNALADEATGAFFTSQELDPSSARATSVKARASLTPATLDTTIHADKNAWAAIGLFKAGVVFDRHDLVQAGLEALDFVVEHLFDPRHGVHHYWNGTWNQPGDLRDQSTVLRALVDAGHYAGIGSMLETATQVAVWADEHLSASDGSFQSDLHAPEKPAATRNADDLRDNAVMAEALIRLGVQVGDERWSERGRAALMAFLGSERQHGFATAGFGRALDLLVHEPLQVVVVGERGDETRKDLFRAAIRPYVASRVALVLDPEADADTVERLGLAGAEGDAGFPYAIAARAGRTVAFVRDPAVLAAQMLGR